MKNPPMVKKVPKQGHTYVPYGKRVQVMLWSGDSFIAKFRDKEGKDMRFLNHDNIRWKTVRSLRILPTGVLSD